MGASKFLMVIVRSVCSLMNHKTLQEASIMRRIKALLCRATLFASVALIVPAALVTTANAQVSIGIGIGGPPPVCPYGYYDYAPYSCAPGGYYGPGYFYNGIFLGVGPWYQWGYRHGWGNHRFIGSRGGRYYGDGRGHHYAGRPGYRGRSGYRGHVAPRGASRGGGYSGGARPHSAPHGGGHSSGHRSSHAGGHNNNHR
jgi:hypothetical protein